MPEIHDRAEGYVTEIGYTFGYHPRTNPLYMRLALLQAGLRPPRVETACELGFGQGVSLALHAAAGTARWYGNDINPDHVAFARSLADAAGTPVDLSTDSFVEYAARDDLPAFDYVALHGIWSWVSDRNRAAIVDFLGRRLKPGGVAYISYNALPGQAVMEPIRHLVSQYAGRSRDGAIEDRVARAFDFADRLLGTRPAYLQDHPRLQHSFDDMKGSDRRYLVHEFFNRDWRPMHFAEVAGWLAPAGLVHAAPAGYGGLVDALHVEPVQQALLDSVDDPVLRETVRDFLLNRPFRHDYWMKPPPDPAPDGAMRDERIVLVTDRPELPFEIRAALALRRIGPGDATIAAVLGLLSDRRPRSLGELEARLAGTAPLADVAAAVGLLLHGKLVAAAQPDHDATRSRAAAARLNTHLLQALDGGSEIRDLASPLTGGGIPVGWLEQQFLKAWRAGEASPDRWVGIAEAALARRATPAAPSAESLSARATAFATAKLPLLQALLVA